jgi:hypothetical protein
MLGSFRKNWSFSALSLTDRFSRNATGHMKKAIKKAAPLPYQSHYSAADMELQLQTKTD